MNERVLEISGLYVDAGDKTVVRKADLVVKKGEVHVLFGPNGSGKSTLLSAVMKLPGYALTAGSIRVKGTDTADLTTDAVAGLGVGMSFQHPPAVKGVTLERFLKTINRSGNLEEEVRALDMERFLKRELNVGFSGGELKRAEILKLYAQDPDLLLIDEPESGVDIENIAVIAGAINTILQKGLPAEQREKSALIITHTGHILSYLDADVGHVFMDGRIVRTGDPQTLMKEIRRLGFSGLKAGEEPL